jgi:hypothetical protein
VWIGDGEDDVKEGPLFHNHRYRHRARLPLLDLSWKV